ncbi:MAG TPA: DMT family transporter [Bacteroidota bacterium]|nr:DMT family transporter [Bacteroidota bacterium]
MNIPFFGELCALITACFWSMSPLFFSAAIDRVGTVTVNITRLTFALVFLVASVIVMRYSVSMSLTQYAYLSISGFLGLVFGDSFMFKGFQFVGARITMLIMALSPAIAAVLAFVVLGEHMPLLGIAGIALTLSGIIWVVLERKQGTERTPHKLPTIGLFYAFCGAIGQGSGLVFAKLALREGGAINGLVATLIRIAAAWILLIPIAMAARTMKNPITAYRSERRALWLTAGGALVGPFLGITFSLMAVAHTEVGVAATIMAMVPIVMLPLLKIFYHEELTWKSIAGAFVAVAGVVLLFLK